MGWNELEEALAVPRRLCIVGRFLDTLTEEQRDAVQEKIRDASLAPIRKALSRMGYGDFGSLPSWEKHRNNQCCCTKPEA